MRAKVEKDQRIFQAVELLSWAEAFLQDRKASGLAPGSLKFYRCKLQRFLEFCEVRGIEQVEDITPETLRGFLLLMAETHSQGGCHAFYRAVKAFLRWYETEVEPEAWRNPIKRVKAPKVPIEPLEPVSLDVVRLLLGTCKPDFTGMRDRAILLTLLDTGLRAAELIALDIDDLDPISGATVIRHGKGGKSRVVFLGRTSRKAIRKYLKKRSDDNPAIFVTKSVERLGYDGLRGIIRRRAAIAGVPAPTIHSFRRAFALNSLRAGTNVFVLQRLMGHSSLAVLRRYLAITTQDTQAGYKSPVNGSGL